MTNSYLDPAASASGARDPACAFTVPGQPVPKGRPRFTRRGGFPRAYTPAATASYENLVRLAAQAAMAGSPPFRGPVSLFVVIYLAIPRSWSEKRRAAALDGTIAATKRPDADNILKCLKDAMNGVVYDDDAQIVRIELDKHYGEVPRCEVRAGVITAAQAAP